MEEFEKRTQFPAVKTGEWIVTLLVTMIPLVGIIMLFVWAFGGNANPSKANYAKAGLIFMAIVFALYVLIAIVFGATLLAGLDL
jgi:succinate dehydrogenase/fumarate reductase cytochrome b subunit